MEPMFFKYVVPLACTERLTVPPAHHWNKDRDFPDNVLLTDKEGNRWPVKLEKIDNYVCFVDGWLDFVKDNNVQVGDFVVFENVDSNVYSVLLLDPNTACKKEGFNSDGVNYESFEESEDVKEEDITEEKEEDEDEDVEEEEYDNDDDDDDDEEEAGDFNFDEESVELRGNISRWNGSVVQKRKEKSTNTPGGSNRSTDIYGNAIFKSRGIPLPKNPYFVTHKRTDRKDELFVPLHVIEDYNLKLPKKTIMRDSKGTEWTTELTIWKDGRRWYYGGWSNFCRKNHIVDETETCICEFVEEAGKGLILFVYKLPELI